MAKPKRRVPRAITISRLDVVRIAALAGVDPRTVERHLRGQVATLPIVRRAIDAARVELGL